MAETTGYLHPAAARRRKGHSRGSCVYAQIQLIEQLFRSGAPDLKRNRLHFEHGENVLFHRQLAKNRWLLGQIANAILPRPEIHGYPRNIDVVYKNLSRIGSDKTDNHVKAGGLARHHWGPATRPLRPDRLQGLRRELPDDLIRLADFVCTKFLHSFRNHGSGSLPWKHRHSPRRYHRDH